MAFRVRTRLDAGKRDRLITLQQRSTADAIDADSGEPVETWSTLVASMPATRQDVQGFERFRAEQPAAAADVRWEINYRMDMDPELIDVPKTRRILSESRQYDIVAASLIGRKRGVELWTLSSSKVPS